MNKQEILKLFEQTGAILKGHFKLSSGLHSDTYLQCARLLMYPDKAELLFPTGGNKLPGDGGAEILIQNFS